MATSKRVEGKTPNGGTYSIINFLDDDFELVDEKDATSFELVEYNDSDEQVWRTYGSITTRQPLERLDL
jgi:hypothetical protein